MLVSVFLCLLYLYLIFSGEEQKLEEAIDVKNQLTPEPQSKSTSVGCSLHEPAASSLKIHENQIKDAPLESEHPKNPVIFSETKNEDLTKTQNVPSFNLTLDLHQNLTHEKLLERFAMRKNNLVEECRNRGDFGLTGVSMTENSIYYNDQYKIIACFPLKSGTTHWQTVMAILESDGKKTAFDDNNFDYGKSESLRNLGESIGKSSIVRVAFLYH